MNILLVTVIFFFIIIICFLVTVRATTTTTSTTGGGGYYTSDDPINDIGGAVFNLLFKPDSRFPGNASQAYRKLTATVMNTANPRDFRVRVVPASTASSAGPEDPAPFEPYVVPSDVVWWSDPAKLVGMPTFDPGLVDWAASVSGLGDITVSQPAPSSTTPIIRLENFTFESYRVSFSFQIKSTVKLFGYGEHDANFCLSCDETALPISLAILNTDEPGYVKGNIPGKYVPLYGTHPVLYMFDDDALEYHVVQFLSSQPQRLTIGKANTEEGTRTLTLEFLGGIVDFLYIRRSSPVTAVQAWTLTLNPSYSAEENARHSSYGTLSNNKGGSAELSPQPLVIPPYWTMGVIQSRWGWHNLQALEEALASYDAAAMKLDMMLVDIDMMAPTYQIFTVDQTRFSGIKDFVANKLHAQGKHFGSIVDPGVAKQTTFVKYQELLANSAYVREPYTNEPATGVVWPGWTIFPDFSSQKIGPLIDKWVSDFVDETDASMLWSDMNEESSFSDGNCFWTATNNSGLPGVDWATVDWAKLPEIIAPYCPGPSKNSTLNFIIDPAKEDWLFNNYSFFTRALDAESRFDAGLHFSVRNMYGFYENVRLRAALLKKRPNKRPFLLSRASFIGQGKVSAIWLGDNFPTWESMRASLSGVLTGNLYGMPMLGADMGGFGGGPTEAELMLRWSQLGLLCYTWARYHKNNRVSGPGIPVLPSQFPDRVKSQILAAMTTRYRFLAPYMFSNLMRMSRSGQPVISHPYFAFSQSALLENDPQTNFPRSAILNGDSILIVPVTVQGQRTVNIRWPGTRSSTAWFSLYTPHALIGRGSTIEPFFPAAPYDDPTPAFLRGGSILPTHGNVTPASLELCRAYAYDLIVVSHGGAASGFGFFDDQQDGLVSGAGTYAHLEYSASVASGGVYGSVSSVLRSEPPAGLRSRSFIGGAMTVTVVYTLPSGGATAATPRQCLVNGTFACSLKKLTTTAGSGQVSDTVTVTLLFEITGARIDATMPWHLTWSSAPTTTPVPPLPTDAPTSAPTVPVVSTAVPVSPPTTTANASSNSNSSGKSAGSGAAEQQGGHFNRALLGICICLGLFLVIALIAIVWIKRGKPNEDPFYTELNSA